MTSSPSQPVVSTDGDVEFISSDANEISQANQRTGSPPIVTRKSTTTASLAARENEGFSHQFEVIASVPLGGTEISKQRQALYELLPSVNDQVAKLLSQATQKTLSTGEKLVKENVEKLVKAQHRAGAAKAVSTRCGVPPDDPNFDRVCRIEDQLERFMTEVIHLHKLSDSYRTEIDKMRSHASMVRSHTPELVSMFKAAKRQNQLFEFVKNIPDPMANGDIASRPATEPGRRRSGDIASRPATEPGRCRSGDSSGSMKLPRNLADSSRFIPLTAPDATMNRSARGGRSGSVSARASPSTSIANSPLDDLSTSRAVSDRQSSSLRKSAFDHIKTDAEPEQSNLDWLDKRISSLAAGQHKPVRETAQRTLTLSEARKIQYENEIEHLENQLKLTRREVQDLKENQAQTFIKRGKLEEFFLLCINDCKKDLLRRRSVNAARKTRLSSKHASPSIAISESLMDARRYRFDRAKVIDVIDVLVDSDALLSFLFEKLFPHREAFSYTKKSDAFLKKEETLPALPAGLFE